MLDKYDKQAILALLIRQVRAQDVNARERAIRDAAIKVIKETDDAQAIIRDALRAFGFDPKVPKMWDAVREAIGAELFDSAFTIARANVPEIGASGEEEGEGEEEEEGGDQTVSSKPEDATDNADDSTPLPNIRELVLDRLLAAGGAGTEAAPIKAYVEKTLKTSIHAKTVGMTLWRLSKSGLARREGRTWFRVNDQETLGDGGENEEAPAAETEEAP